ncbi:MAG: TetR family transcriptional regulator [Nakamurella sp.]
MRGSADVTRERILEHARAQFGATGFERTTIRSVAKAAGIDPALVMRHFGTKEGLFAAAIEISLELPPPAALPIDELAERLAEHFVRLWDSTPALQILLRTAATHPLGAERMRAVFTDQVAPWVARLPAGGGETGDTGTDDTGTGDSGTDGSETASVRAALVASAVLGFALCRYVIEIPALAAMSPQQAATHLGPSIALHLH